MYFFWYKSEFKQKIENRLKQIRRFDLLDILFPHQEKAKHNKKEVPKHKTNFSKPKTGKKRR